MRASSYRAQKSDTPERWRIGDEHRLMPIRMSHVEGESACASLAALAETPACFRRVRPSQLNH